MVTEAFRLLYKPTIQTLRYLPAYVSGANVKLPNQFCRTMDSLKRRAETCLLTDGVHLSDVIFKT
jgi:hypothetical protein